VVLRALLLLALALAGPDVASARVVCAPGAFVVQQGDRLLPDVAGSHDVIQVARDGARWSVALAGTCPPVRARLRGRRLRARWPASACGTVGRVRLAATFDEGCERLRGKIARGRRRTAFAAPRCAADGVVSGDAGEQCATADACGPGAACVDCRCTPAVSFARDVVPIFQDCLTAACHEGANAPGSFQLVADLAYAELLSRRARAGACAGRPLVVPGDPDGSTLFARVAGFTCDGRMPLGSIALPPASVDAIRAWIAQGAAAN
jgi:hypothetical protein